MGAGSTFSPPSSVQLRGSGVQTICTQLPSIPSSLARRCPAPHLPMERLKDVTKGRQDPEFMASILGLP